MLTNAEKAVLFLLSLEEETAKRIVEELGEAELRKLRTVAATMRQVPKDAIERTLREFLAQADGAMAIPRGGLSYLRRISASALGESKTRAVFEDGGTSALMKLELARPEDVAGILEQEPPQLVAALLAAMPSTSASPILFAMSEECQTAVVRFVGRMTHFPANVVEDVAAAIASNLPAKDETSLVRVDGVARAAELLNATGRKKQDSILGFLEGDDPDLALDVRQAMFTFDDLARIDSRGMRVLLREISTDRLVVALKGASEAVLESFLSGLSSRAAQLLRDDLEAMAGGKKSEVEGARKELVAIALRLEAEGQLDLGRGEQE